MTAQTTNDTLQSDIRTVDEYLGLIYHCMETSNALRAFNAFQNIKDAFELKDVRTTTSTGERHD
jgi:hypothetical protein